jgi:hypothetical protein
MDSNNWVFRCLEIVISYLKQKVPNFLVISEKVPNYLVTRENSSQRFQLSARERNLVVNRLDQ